MEPDEVLPEGLETETTRILDRLIADLETESKAHPEAPTWETRMLQWCLKDPELRMLIFRFTDVYPSLAGSRQVVRHIREYFDDPGHRLPTVLRLGSKLAGEPILSGRLIAAETGLIMNRFARRFIAGETAEETAGPLKGLLDNNFQFTLDVLGEAVLSEVEADRYLDDYLKLIERIPQLIPDGGAGPGRTNVSIKLSSLYSRFDSIDPDGANHLLRPRLRKLFAAAKDRGAFVNVDVEQYRHRDLTWRIFVETLAEPAFADWADVGFVVQAYLVDSAEFTERVIDWARERGTPIQVRLVKGAYWDHEIIYARARDWPVPVFRNKAETDLRFEELAEKLLGNHAYVRTAIGSHNLRSIARTLAVAGELDVPPEKLEFQLLFGMGQAVGRTLLAMNRTVRVYAPIGRLIPGMAYLVRRLLENTANEAVFRVSLLSLPPDRESLGDPRRIASIQVKPDPTPVVHPFPFRNESLADYSLGDFRDKMTEAIAEVKKTFGRYCPLVVGGQRIETDDRIRSVNPARPSEIVGESAQANEEQAQLAVMSARKAFDDRRGRGRGRGSAGPEGRAELHAEPDLIMRLERFELAALEIAEVGKSWREADGDVCEAIDYLEYYAAESGRLGRPESLTSLPGETNHYGYRPRGVVAIIAPWNFPLAILTGMTAAALAAGNTVVIKPAEQSPVTAWKLYEILERAGFSPGAVNYLPGIGETVGDYLVRSPEVDMIAFTGSRAVGLAVNRLAAEVRPGQANVKKVITEMGGKNAIIVDDTADIDETILGISASAFGYSGQKCSAASRIITVGTAADSLFDRLVERVKSLKVGDPEDPAVQVGPLIDRNAVAKTRGYIETGRTDGTVLVEVDVSSLGDGFYVGPTVIGDVSPESKLAQEEIFGPVLTVLPAKDFNEALRIANGTPYALTAGVYSRTPSHIERVKGELAAGNIYVNRTITGAVVGRQPFGGYRMSGIGSKAGGPDYLTQYMIPVSVTEDITRHGFTPL